MTGCEDEISSSQFRQRCADTQNMSCVLSLRGLPDCSAVPMNRNIEALRDVVSVTLHEDRRFHGAKYTRPTCDALS